MRRGSIRDGSDAGRPPLPTDISLNCPYCGSNLVNVPSDNAQAFYECQTDGLLVLPPDGRMRRVGTQKVTNVHK